MTCKQFDSIRVVSGLSFTLTECKSALMWLLSESEVCLLCQSSHNQSWSLCLWAPAKAVTQTNGSMPMQYNPWTGEQASAGTKLENANGDELIYTRPQLFKRWITIRYPWIYLYPGDNANGFSNTYPLDSDLSGGWCIPTFEQSGPVVYGALVRPLFCAGIFYRRWRHTLSHE